MVRGCKKAPRHESHSFATVRFGPGPIPALIAWPTIIDPDMKRDLDMKRARFGTFCNLNSQCIVLRIILSTAIHIGKLSMYSDFLIVGE